MSGPSDIYAAALGRGMLLADGTQQHVVQLMQRIYDELRSQKPRRWRFWRQPSPVRGLYIWGGVGIGKTCLMNFLYESVADLGAQRLHFHRFMHMVHSELKKRQGQSDPLRDFAASYSRKVRLLLFDEFYVSDITDAMLIGNLLQALFAHGVGFVATSNEAPQRLYYDGLQRERFLPAIKLIEENTEVIHMEGSIDYRSRYLQTAGVYYCPIDGDSHRQMQGDFERFTTGDNTQVGTIRINGRDLQVLGHGDDCVWMKFIELCGTARNVADYMELASLYPILLLSDMPQLGPDDDDMVRRFISLIDELYERRVKLIVSAAVAAEQLYTGTRHAAIFRRTVSRLSEMAGKEYLALAHLA